MVKINEIHSTATFAFSNDPIPILATGTAAGVIDDNFSSSSTLDFYGLYDKEPLVSIEADSKFHDLDWSKNGKLLAGALENGKIQFWDTENLSSKKVQAVAAGDKHTGTIKSLQFNPIQHNILASGGANSEIFIWDTNKITNLAPFVPGTAMTPMDTITSVAWNNSVSHIFASAGSAGYSSIWDLKAKKEVLHLSYSSPTGSRATLSTVAWHPTQSTKLITASEFDGVPVILSWDLRNSNAPENILSGHKKGILSLDWNARDPSLLLSSGKDNTTILWNPLTSEKLAQYPTTANWAFKTRFAPATPDIFATASFDKRVIVQTLQDTSPPISKRMNSTNETEFWSQISENETQQPEYFVKQAPNWYGRPTSVSFAFGGNIVTVAKTGDKTSEIKVSKSQLPGSSNNEALNKALNSSDFKEIIESRLENSFDDVNKSDWELLEKLSGETDIFEKFIALKLDDGEPTEQQQPTKSADDEDFFTHLTEEPAQYAPSGPFKISAESQELSDALLSKNFSKAVDISLKGDKLVEALIIALNGSQELKDKVKNFYFNKYADDDSVARLLYSTSSNNVADLVENGDISNWRQIGAAIKNYSASDKEVYKTYFTKLGDRVLAADPIKNRNDAILNYINASSLDKVANIWTDELQTLESKFLTSKKTSAYDAHFDSLTEFVEKFSAYRSILKLDAPISESERFLSTILEFTNIISNNGQFELASKFLNLLSDSIPAVKLEKERIARASGITQTAASSTAKSAATRYGSISANQVPNVASPVRGRPPINGNPYLPQASAAPTPVGNPYGQPQASTPYGQPQVPTPYGQPPAPNQFGQPPIPNQFGQPPVANAYAQPTSVIQPPASGNPYRPATAATNPYKPVETAPAFAPNQGLSAAAIPPPPKNGRKISTDGWNDLPTGFHKPRLPTPAAAVSVTPAASSPVVGQLSRTTSFASQPVAPPPPRSVSKSRKTTPIPEPKAEVPSSASSRYAPVLPSPQLNTPSLNNGAFPPPPSFGSSTPLAPPTNPYASPSQPPAAAPLLQPTNPYAPPPAAATSQQQQSNPYAQPPQATQQLPTNPYAITAQPAQQAPVNPYAPPPTAAQSFAQPPNSYGQPQAQPIGAPPNGPLRGSLSGPPPAGPPRATPITASASIEQAVQLQQQQIPEEPAKVNYPAGDRSHIPESQLKIYQILESQFNAAKPSIPERYAKQIADTDKRLNVLFDHLNNEELSDVVISKLINLVDLLNERKTAEATNVHLDIATNHSSEGGHWLVGIKRLIQFVEALN